MEASRPIVGCSHFDVPGHRNCRSVPRRPPLPPSWPFGCVSVHASNTSTWYLGTYQATVPQSDTPATNKMLHNAKNSALVQNGDLHFPCPRFSSEDETRLLIRSHFPRLPLPLPVPVAVFLAAQGVRLVGGKKQTTVYRIGG